MIAASRCAKMWNPARLAEYIHYRTDRESVWGRKALASSNLASSVLIRFHGPDRDPAHRVRRGNEDYAPRARARSLGQGGVEATREIVCDGAPRPTRGPDAELVRQHASGAGPRSL